MSIAASPFQDKLGTNYVPSEPEVEEIRGLLVNPNEELARIDAQIDEMDHVVRRLREERASLHTIIDAHKALVSPMRRTPQDILQEIFIACISTAHNALIDPDEAPMLLGRICRHWRRVAYSTPRLWSSLHIPGLTISWDAPDPPPHVEHKLESFIKAWLDRSGACPLSISFCRSPYVVGTSSHIVNQLRRVSRRIRQLRLYAHTFELQPLLLLGAEDLPILEDILILSATSGINMDHFTDAAMFRIPTLRRFSLQGEARALDLHLGWSQLTELNLDSYEIEVDDHGPHVPGGLDENGALEVLHRCSQLVRCRLRLNPIMDEPFVERTIHLPLLEVLILRNPNDPVQFARCLVMPKLYYLHFGQTEYRTSFFDGSFPEQEGQGLTAVLSGDICTARAALHEFIYLIPGISHLRLRGSEYKGPAPVWLNDDFLSDLTATAFPSLKHLDMDKECCAFSDAGLLAFIRGRMTTDHPLRLVDLEFDRPIEVDILPELEIHISKGLHVNLRYSSLPPWKFNARYGLGAFEGV
ncbi:hypothetical protein B0H11DRAFT_2017470 [Mycena galericulata]|nr:hypothetical protein B0H11DRAFT_2017470 [Mycena galericulata]